MAQRVLEALQERFGEAIVETHAHRGDETARVVPERIREICEFLKSEPSLDFNMLMDVTCVDRLHLEPSTPRFEVVYHLYSLRKKHRVRLKARVPEEDPRLPSVVPVWKGANWFEREVYDLYGVTFDGHPDLRRILLYPEFEGHPLRKDYPLDGEQPLVEMRDPESQRPVMPSLESNLVRSIGTPDGGRIPIGAAEATPDGATPADAQAKEPQA
ncbi:MAG: NADH-quinone oxidoreductase subunit C [Deltaproteobacteria bacterium]|nr:MAG: NADH-quinone oxidoreductase subunit C [Deltaproteobacteria bacterium]